MGRVALDDPCLDGVGKNATKKTDGARGRSSAASDDGLPPQIGKIAGAQLLHSDRFVIELAIFDGIVTPSDPTELHPCLSACSLWRPGSVKPNCVPTRPTSRSILDDVAALSGTKNPKAKARQLVVPD